MSEAPKTVWVTSGALEVGIREFELFETSNSWASVKHGWERNGNLRSVPLIDCHPTREAALTRAEEMRAAKIASLKRQIERLESLEF